MKLSFGRIGLQGWNLPKIGRNVIFEVKIGQNSDFEGQSLPKIGLNLSRFWFLMSKFAIISLNLWFKDQNLSKLFSW